MEEPIFVNPVLQINLYHLSAKEINGAPTSAEFDTFLIGGEVQIHFVPLDGAAAVLGDQLLTDSLAAHRAELVSIIVPPIRDRTGAFFRFKRAVERPYIKKFLRSPDAPALSGTVWHKNHDTGKTETENS